MKVPVPIRVYADFECINQPENFPNNPNVLFKQIPIAVGFYLITPSGSKYCSYFGIDCVKRFVNEMLTLQHEANMHFKTNIPLQMTSEEEQQFEQSIICWLCEEPFISSDEKVRDHDHLTGKYRGAAHNICNINCKQSHQVLFLYFSITFLGMIVILYFKNS